MFDAALRISDFAKIGCLVPMRFRIFNIYLLHNFYKHSDQQKHHCKFYIPSRSLVEFLAVVKFPNKF